MGARIISIGVAALAAVLGMWNVATAVPPPCDLHVHLQLTPDVPNPRDPGFLNAIVGNPLYQLIWVRDTDTGIVAELTGPGPGYRCQDAISQLSRDAHVLDVKVLDWVTRPPPRGEAAHHEEHRRQYLEKKLTAHDEAIAAIFSAIRQLMNPPAARRRPIGFTADLEEKS